MKRSNLIIKILAIIIICLIGFAGIYLPWKKPFEMNNIIKDFNLSKDLKGYREITINVSDEEDNLNEENYNKSKTLIEKRLIELGVQDYNLSMDKQSGNMYLQIPEDNLTDRIVSNISETGKVELKDSEDENNVILTSDKLKKSTYFYNTASTGKTTVYLELQFNKEGTEILKNITENEYKTLPEEETKTTEEKSEEESESKETTKQKQVTLYMSENSVTTTSFDEPVEDGKIDLSMGNASTDADSINESLTSARTVSILLNNGPLPIKYEVVENKYVKTDINENTIKSIIICLVINVMLIIYMIYKHKTKGILAAISYIGFVALYILVLKIFNVTIALSGIVGAVIIAVINYLITMKLLNVDCKDNKKYYKQYLDIIMKVIPILGISIAFVYMPITVLASLGMVMFWGITLALLYNVAITKHIVE